MKRFALPVIIAFSLSAAAAAPEELVAYAKQKLAEFSPAIPEKMWAAEDEPGTPSPSYDALAAVFPVESASRHPINQSAAADRAIAEFCAASAPVFRRDYSAGYDMRLPELAVLRSAVKYNLARLDPDASSATEVDGAFVRIRQNFKISRILLDDPMLMSFLMGGAAAMQTVEAAAPLLTHFSDAQLAEFSGELAVVSGKLTSSVLTAVAADVPMLMKTDFVNSSLVSGSAFEEGLKRMSADPAIWTPACRKAVDVEVELLAICRMPAAERLEAVAKFEKKYADAGRDPSMMVAAMITPTSGALRMFVRIETLIDLGRTAAAMELMRRRYGEYPVEIPGIDPYSGKPFVFRSGTLRSVGRNGDGKYLMLKL